MALDPVTGSLLMGTIGNLVNIGSTVANNASMLRNAAEARAFNLQMARMQNEYNSPVNQVSRLVAAGMNPHQAFGGSPTPAASVGEVSPPHLDAPQVDATSMMNAYLGNALMKEEIDYKYAVLREQAREFDAMYAPNAEEKAAHAALLRQQKEFNDADRAVDVAMSDERLKSLRLDNEYKDKANRLELEYKEWRNAFEPLKGSYELTKAKYENLILGNQKYMSDIDAKLYDVISGYKAEILKAGVDAARLNNILLQTDKEKRDAEIAKLKSDIDLNRQLFESRGVHVPWVDYSLDVLGSLVSMVTSFIPFAGGSVRGSSYNKNGQ